MGKKLGEYRNVKDKCQECNQQNDKRVYDSFGHNGSQSLGKRNVVVTFQYHASGKFTNAGNGETCCIGEEYGVERDLRARLFAFRFQ